MYELPSGRLLHTREVLDDEAVHGLEAVVVAQPNDSPSPLPKPPPPPPPPPLLLLLHGVRQVRVYRLDSSGRPTEILACGCACRVLALRELLHLNALAVGCDDNVLRLWHLPKPEAAAAVATAAASRAGRAPLPVQRISCTARSILYAMALQRVADPAAPMLAAVGSAFRTVLVWDARPVAHGDTLSQQPPHEHCRRPPLWQLEGHEGAVFRLAWSGTLLASVSDDRRAMLWRVVPPSPGSEAGAADAGGQPPLLRSEHSWFAHSVRIWDCCWASDGGEEGLQLATAGEDGSAKLWRIACGRSTKGGGGERIELLSTLRGHAGKHVWCVAASSGGAGSPRLLASGGADGAVKLWPLSSAASDGGDRDEHRLCKASLELSSIEVSGGEGLPRDAPIRAVQV